jgi:hypothetical protein
MITAASSKLHAAYYVVGEGCVGDAEDDVDVDLCNRYATAAASATSLKTNTHTNMHTRQVST